MDSTTPNDYTFLFEEHVSNTSMEVLLVEYLRAASTQTDFAFQLNRTKISSPNMLIPI